MNLVNNIVGYKPIGFRTPSLSLDNSTKWVLPILKERNFKYDSSIFPVRTTFYGVSHAPIHPYKLDFDNVSKEGYSNIIEFPLLVLPLVRGLRLPVAGGFYL